MFLGILASDTSTCPIDANAATIASRSLTIGRESQPQQHRSDQRQQFGNNTARWDLSLLHFSIDPFRIFFSSIHKFIQAYMIW